MNNGLVGRGSCLEVNVSEARGGSCVLSWGLGADYINVFSFRKFTEPIDALLWMYIF